MANANFRHPKIDCQKWQSILGFGKIDCHKWQSIQVDCQKWQSISGFGKIDCQKWQSISGGVKIDCQKWQSILGGYKSTVTNGRQFQGVCDGCPPPVCLQITGMSHWPASELGGVFEMVGAVFVELAHQNSHYVGTN